MVQEITCAVSKFTCAKLIFEPTPKEGTVRTSEAMITFQIIDSVLFDPVIRYGAIEGM